MEENASHSNTLTNIENIMKPIIAILDTTNKCLCKRLEREIRELITLGLYSNINIIPIKTLNPYTYNDTTTYYKIEITQIKDNTYYEFIISSDYPFKPPKLIINEKPYYEYFKFKNHAFKEVLYKYSGISCFCCETILCWSNWTPHYKIISILNEVGRFKQICREIAYRIMIDVIKRKHLVYDINIIEWLF